MIQYPFTIPQSIFHRRFKALAIAVLFASLVRSHEAGAAAGERPRKVLMILSGADSFELAGGAIIPSGVFLSEFAPTVRRLEAAGYEIDFATPGAVQPTFDAHGLNINFYSVAYRTLTPQAQRLRDDDLDVAVEYFVEPRFSADTTGDPEVAVALGILGDRIRRQSPRPLPRMLAVEDLAADTARLDGYAGIYFPGGHAPKADLLTGPASDAVAAILQVAHERQMPTFLICHAPVLLLAALPGRWTHERIYSAAERGSFIYRGYRITIGSRFEESLLEDFFYLRGQRLKFKVQDEVEEAGLQVQNQRIPTQPEVVCDREVCTGANPASVVELSDRFLDHVEAYRQRRP
jgi:putative intracellular protease/amidase